jgi:Rad3-related DNA helicase
MIFCPSVAYSKALYDAFVKKYPKIRTILQTPDMSAKQKDDFLAEFSKEDGKYLAAFCVLGGIYSEGIDLAGDKLIGAVIVGIGMPALSFEREAIAAYYQEKIEAGVEYAYLYPGMNRVLQAAGRVIRTENDRGVIVLIDDRFNDPIYKKIIPSLWRGMQFLSTPQELKERLEEFWLDIDSET